jgi:hypothetical protein
MRLPLVLLTVTAVWSPAIAQTRPPPVAPVPIALDDDPAHKACIRLDPKTGATLRWRETSNPYPVAHYVEVERFDFVSQQWRSWYKGYVETSLTLRPKNPLYYNAKFAWRVWSVDGTGEAKPYAQPNPWMTFCTQRQR